MDYLTSKLEHESLYKTEFEDDEYVVWTPLKWGEYKKYRAAAELMEDSNPSVLLAIEEEVYRRCVVFSSFDHDPPDEVPRDKIPLFIEDSRSIQIAGIISTVVKCILRISGAKDPDRLIKDIESMRPYVMDTENQLAVTICRAFPAYKPEDIEQMEWSTVVERFVQAEASLMGRFVGLPLTVLDPNKPSPNNPPVQAPPREKKIGRAHV